LRARGYFFFVQLAGSVGVWSLLDLQFLRIVVASYKERSPPASVPSKVAANILFVGPLATTEEEMM
jgi:hypothetical protein